MSNKKRSTGGGRFDPNEQPLYFISGGSRDLEAAGQHHDTRLIAVNALTNVTDRAIIEQCFVRRQRVLLDSGIFALCMEYAQAKEIPLHEAFRLAPEQIDGFDTLQAAYIRVVREFEDRLWGYVELDQGGMENKIRTRRRLESMGLRPIPVYHVLLDPADYLDQLVNEYDRICIGNLVQAPREVRLPILAALWEHKRRHPGVWFHLLGYTPDELLNAYYFESADSSTFLSSMRWGRMYDRALNRAFDLRRGFVPGLTAEGVATDSPGGRTRAQVLAGFIAASQERTWRLSVNRCTQLGLHPERERQES